MSQLNPNPNPNPDASVSARRRLLRGMLAAPAVLPLSAAADPVAASNLRCIVNRINNADGEGPKETEAQIPWTSGGDIWVRVKLWRATNPTDATKHRYYVNGNDISFIANGKPIGLAAPNSGQWMLVKDDAPAAGSYSPSPDHSIGVPFASGSPPAWVVGANTGVATTSYTPEQWAAVRFDNLGNIVGVVPVGSSPSSALKKTCWTSFSGFMAYPG